MDKLTEFQERCSAGLMLAKDVCDILNVRLSPKYKVIYVLDKVKNKYCVNIVEKVNGELYSFELRNYLPYNMGYVENLLLVIKEIIKEKGWN